MNNDTNNQTTETTNNQPEETRGQRIKREREERQAREHAAEMEKRARFSFSQFCAQFAHQLADLIGTPLEVAHDQNGTRQGYRAQIIEEGHAPALDQIKPGLTVHFIQDTHRVEITGKNFGLIKLPEDLYKSTFTAHKTASQIAGSVARNLWPVYVERFDQVKREAITARDEANAFAREQSQTVSAIFAAGQSPAQLPKNCIHPDHNDLNKLEFDNKGRAFFQVNSGQSTTIKITGAKRDQAAAIARTLATDPAFIYQETPEAFAAAVEHARTGESAARALLTHHTNTGAPEDFLKRQRENVKEREQIARQVEALAANQPARFGEFIGADFYEESTPHEAAKAAARVIFESATDPATLEGTGTTARDFADEMISDTIRALSDLQMQIRATGYHKPEHTEGAAKLARILNSR